MLDETEKMVENAKHFIKDNKMEDAVMCCEDADRCGQRDSCTHGHPHDIDVSCITAKCWHFSREGKRACQRILGVFG